MTLTSHLRATALRGSWLLAGILSVVWLILRSGTKPSRVTYPCQRAAASTVALTLGLPLAGPLAVPLAGFAASRRRLGRALASTRSAAPSTRLSLGLLCLLGASVAVLAFTISGFVSSEVLLSAGAAGLATPPPAPPLPAAVTSALADYRATVFHVSGCPENPVGDRFLGLDNLLALMGQKGLKFYKSSTQSLVAGPNGIIGPDDVVIIKFNYQWPERGGTNVDLLRGLVRRILDHPDSFTGEVVLCENAQFNSTSNFDRALNNAQDQAISPRDIVTAFQQAGANVSLYDWTLLRYTSVAEYSAGDTLDGYVVLPYKAAVNGSPSYPKFKTQAGTRISLKYGIWDSLSQTYSREHLKFINVPVLKSHHAVYGATCCVKNYMGLVTRELGTNSHAAIWYGILGAVIGEIGPADLNIVDAIWVNADPNSGPQTTYAGATRRNELVAGVDPVAVDVWAVKHILNPAFIQNGFLPPWPLPDADADNPNSHFRKYLDNSMQQILAAGYVVTNDQTKIDAVNGNGAAGDFDFDGEVGSSIDLRLFDGCLYQSQTHAGPLPSYCYPGDFNADSDVDCADWAALRFVWTAAGGPPDEPGCPNVGVEEPGATAPAATQLSRVFPNPVNGDVTILYSVGEPGRVAVRIVDTAGRVMRTLFDAGRDGGSYSATWDRKDESGETVSSGVYFCQLEAAGERKVSKLVVVQ